MLKAMKTSLLLGGILGVGAIGFVLTQESDNPIEDYVGPAALIEIGSGPLDSHNGLSLNRVNRSFQNPSSAQEAAWRDSPEMQAKFQKAFLESFYRNSGEEKAIQSIVDTTQRQKEAGNWRHVSSAVTAMREAGMAMTDETENLFSGLLAPEYHEVGNVFQRQLKEYREWLSVSDKKHFHFPESRLVDFPMSFPPEMHFAYLSGTLSGGEYSQELLKKAAYLRDQSIREYARLVLDKTVMLPSITGASASSGLYFQGRERDEALSLLLPAYQNISEAIDEVQSNYPSALRELFASYGYQVLPNR